MTRARLSCVALFLLAGAPASADVVAASPDGIWSVLDAVPAAQQAADAWVRPPVFKPATLNVAQLSGLLAQAPKEGTRAASRPITVWLPLPNGKFARFSVVESPIMEPALAAKFPEIRTYLGQGIDDRGSSVRFDMTPAGFHAQILTTTEAYYIDPYSRGDTTFYAVYDRADMMAAAPGWMCHTPPGGARRRPPVAIDMPSGDQLRTYRAAVAATGEFTQFHGGTVQAGMAAIVTGMNRVVGIMEREVSVRLVLVGNNNQLVYTDPLADPYSDGNPPIMIFQNQVNLDGVIGSAGYDIGHVLGAVPGGGLASLGVVCETGLKARGASTSDQPTGDAMFVGIVAHEMGHQFGAEHSFNSDQFACMGNRAPDSAFEPGSGSTIMSYAGLCGPDNLQEDSDPYYSSGSYDQIRAFIAGTSCATTTNTGNNWPTVDAGPDYVIPAQTPFALTASGSDPDGDRLSYTWEQRDLGPSTTLAQGDTGAGPIIRSLASATPTRIIPRPQYLLSNSPSPGEALPSSNRTMTFRVTARDNRAGGGGVNFDEMQVTVVNSAGPFRVTSPNSVVTWSGEQTVTWQVAGTNQPPINCANVSISLSIDGGNTFPFVLAASTPNDGSHTVTLPNLSTNSARIKVAAVDNIFFDVSNVNFRINPGAAGNNACENAIIITGPHTPFSTISATTDGPPEPGCNFCCGDTQINQDVWFRYTAECTGPATVDICDANYDSKLAVYLGGCPVGSGTALACSDDDCGLTNQSSRVTWNAIAGQTYTIRVGGFQGATGSGVVVVSCAGSCYANCDESSNPPILNVNDFICFQQRFAAGHSYANCDGSTNVPILNVNDFICFQQQFAAGCR